MAGKGSHYCIDFGSCPNPTAASLKEPVEAEGGLWDAFLGVAPSSGPISVWSQPPARGEVTKVSPPACPLSGLSFLPSTSLGARRECGVPAGPSPHQGKNPMASNAHTGPRGFSLKRDSELIPLLFPPPPPQTKPRSTSPIHMPNSP